jgi:hypothetical protein
MSQRVTFESMTDPSDVIRASIGGYPILPAGESWPVCTEDECSQKLALFLQFDVDDSFGLPFASGATLSLFQCIKHDDSFEELDKISPKPHDRLPENYWNHANDAIFLAAPGQQQQLAERDPFLTVNIPSSSLILNANPVPVRSRL